MPGRHSTRERAAPAPWRRDHTATAKLPRSTKTARSTGGGVAQRRRVVGAEGDAEAGDARRRAARKRKARAAAAAAQKTRPPQHAAVRAAAAARDDLSGDEDSKRCTPRLPRPNPRALSVSTYAQPSSSAASPASCATASSAQSSPLEAADDDDAADPHADLSLAAPARRRGRRRRTAQGAAAGRLLRRLGRGGGRRADEAAQAEEDEGRLAAQDSPCIAIDIVTNGNLKAKRIIALSAAYLGPMDAQTDPTVTAVTDAPIFSEYARACDRRRQARAVSARAELRAAAGAAAHQPARAAAALAPLALPRRVRRPHAGRGDARLRRRGPAIPRLDWRAERRCWAAETPVVFVMWAAGDFELLCAELLRHGMEPPSDCTVVDALAVARASKRTYADIGGSPLASLERCAAHALSKLWLADPRPAKKRRPRWT